MDRHKRRLIEVALPLEAINKETMRRHRAQGFAPWFVEGVGLE
jgi:hypothetical protein